MTTEKRFVVSKEERGVWSVWDRKTGWWASADARWMKKADAEKLARELNASERKAQG
jgi:hypothetical protein